MKYRARVFWKMGGYIIVDADNEDDAKEKVDEAPLPSYVRSQYLEGSFEIEELKKVR